MNLYEFSFAIHVSTAALPGKITDNIPATQVKNLQDKVLDA